MLKRTEKSHEHACRYGRLIDQPREGEERAPPVLDHVREVGEQGEVPDQFPGSVLLLLAVLERAPLSVTNPFDAIAGPGSEACAPPTPLSTT